MKNSRGASPNINKIIKPKKMRWTDFSYMGDMTTI
jgi:hypothetical protein